VTPLPWLAGLLALYLLAPFAAALPPLVSTGFAGADWATLGGAAGVSVASASLATILVALGGVPLGYLLARGRRGGGTGWAASALGFLVQMPLALPPLSSGVLLLFLLGHDGVLGRAAARVGVSLTDSTLGIVLAESFVSAPFLIIAARSAFEAVDPELEDVARTLGHGPTATFLRASLPLAARGILAGSLLAWLRAFGEFGATVLVAYHPYSLPIYTYVAFGSDGLPAMLPILLPTLGIALTVLLLAALVARRPAHAASDDTPGRPAPAPASLAVVPGGGSTVPRPIAFSLQAAQGGFDLRLACETDARRIAILGASGSGKSLTLRALAGLAGAPRARLVLDGRDLSPLPPERRGVAYVPQSHGLFPHLSLARQIGFARFADPVLARHWCHRLGLDGLEDRRPAALSLGQQQRAALARALSVRADLLLLDEPFSALDTPRRTQLRQDFRALQEEIETTTILVTHDPGEAFELADWLLVLENGRLLQSGPSGHVFLRPASEAVARLSGAGDAASAVVVAPDRLDPGGGLRLRVAGPPLSVGQRVGWTARAVMLDPGADPDGYPAELVSLAPAVLGRSTALIRVGDAVLRAQVAPAAACPGACRVVLPPAAIQVWPAG